MSLDLFTILILLITLILVITICFNKLSNYFIFPTLIFFISGLIIVSICSSKAMDDYTILKTYDIIYINTYRDTIIQDENNNKIKICSNKLYFNIDNNIDKNYIELVRCKHWFLYEDRYVCYIKNK